MTRVRDAAVTLISLAVLIPLLVLSAAIVGLSPRHWSGVPLSGVEMYFLGIHPRYGEPRAPAIDRVTDRLLFAEHRGVVAVVSGPDGQIYLQAVSLEPSLLPALSTIDGAAIAVVYHPLQPQVSLDPGMLLPGDETWWQRTDPAGTWLTLLTGFPVPLGAALLLTAIIWADILHRRRANGP